jgi:hypothetical protein
VVYGACLESKCAQALVGSNPTSSAFAKATADKVRQSFYKIPGNNL